MKDLMKPGPVMAFLGGLLLGFLSAVFGTAQAMAIQTAERNKDRDEQVDKYSKGMTAVIETAAADLQTMRTERDAALEKLDALQPKGGIGG